MNSISKLLATDGYIQVNKTLIHKLGLHEAILIGELCSEYNYWSDSNKLIDEFFYSTRENIENNTGLNEHYQRKAFATLTNANLVEVDKRGLPAKNYYKINFNKLLTALTTSASRDEEQEINDMQINNNNNIKITNNIVVSKDTTTQFFGSAEKTPKKSMYDKCLALINEFTDDAILREMLVKFLQTCLQNAREGGTNFYTNNFKGKLNQLAKLSTDSYNQREIVKQTLVNGWANFYEIKNRQNRPEKSASARSVDYTQDELDKLAEQDEERRLNGERTVF